MANTIKKLQEALLKQKAETEKLKQKYLKTAIQNAENSAQMFADAAKLVQTFKQEIEVPLAAKATRKKKGWPIPVTDEFTA